MNLKTNILSIRLIARGETVDVSWVRDGSPEIYNRVSSNIIRTFIDDWRNWVHVVLITSTKTKPTGGVRKELLGRGKALESLLFGGLPWKLENLNTYKFLVDPEWTLLPFEILPYGENSFIVEHQYVVRSIRFPNPVPAGKKGEGMLLWYQKVPHLQKSLESEKNDLEEAILNKKINYKIFIGRESNARLGFLSMQGIEYFHFAGHSNNEGIFVSEKETIPNSEWDGLDLSNISLAFFNTCYSGLVKESNEGLTQIVLRRGVREFIGYSEIIPTEKAKFIGITFWSFYFNNKSAEEAIFNLRKKYIDTYGDRDIIPYLLVHYKSYSESFHSNINKIKIFISIFLLVFLLIQLNFLIEKKTQPLVEKNRSDEVSSNIQKNLDSNEIKNTNDKKNKDSNQKIVNHPNNKEDFLPTGNQSKEPKIRKFQNHIDSTKDFGKSNKPKIESKIENNKYTNHDTKISLNLTGISNEFKDSIELFLKTKNPLLEQSDKEKIIREILFLDESEDTKRWIFRKKTGF